MEYKIEVIGTNYDCNDMIIDNVEMCDGFDIIDNDGKTYSYCTGGKFRDGIITNCFVHPESDCIWMIVVCNGVYFDVSIDNYKKYETIWIPF